MTLKFKLARKACAYVFTSLLVVVAGLILKPAVITAVCVALTTTFTGFVTSHAYTDAKLTKKSDKEEGS